MKCLFAERRDCPLKGSVGLKDMAGFCVACTNREQLTRMVNNFDVMKAQLILGLLAMFPKDPEQAKVEYQKLMRRVEEW